MTGRSLSFASGSAFGIGLALFLSLGHSETEIIQPEGLSGACSGLNCDNDGAITCTQPLDPSCIPGMAGSDGGLCPPPSCFADSGGCPPAACFPPADAGLDAGLPNPLIIVSDGGGSQVELQAASNSASLTLLSNGEQCNYQVTGGGGVCAFYSATDDYSFAVLKNFCIGLASSPTTECFQPDPDGGATATHPFHAQNLCEISAAHPDCWPDAGGGGSGSVPDAGPAWILQYTTYDQSNTTSDAGDPTNWLVLDQLGFHAGSYKSVHLKGEAILDSQAIEYVQVCLRGNASRIAGARPSVGLRICYINAAAYEYCYEGQITGGGATQCTGGMLNNTNPGLNAHITYQGDIAAGDGGADLTLEYKSSNASYPTTIYAGATLEHLTLDVP